MRASLRTLLAAAVTLTWATAAAAQAPPPPALDLSGAEVKAFIDRLPKDRVSDLPIRVTDVGGYKAVSYTHLDVYKRQEVERMVGREQQQRVR